MSSGPGISDFNPLRYAGPDANLIPIQTFPREPISIDKKYPIGQIVILGKNPSTGNEGDLWYLANFVSGVPDWRLIAGGSGSVTDLRDQVDTLVQPSNDGYIDIDGSTVANGANPSSIPLETVASTNTLTIQQQVAAAITGAPADKNDAGICAFNDTQFTVNADGYVALVGGTDLPGIQTITSDDPTAVGPDANGNIDLTGEAVANATNAKPLYIDAGSNALNAEIQLSTTVAGAPGDSNDAGICSFETVDFSVDANAHVTRINYPRVGVENLGITYSSSTLSVTAADGTALSATNPGYVIMQDTDNPGENKRYTITANQGFIDATGSSEITGNLFGTTTSIAWGENVPFYIYAVYNDDSGTNMEPEIAFMISRVPGRTVSPEVAKIGAPDDAVADTQGSFFSFDNITEADYAGNACLCIGAFRMTKDASDDWTVTALTSSQDGIGMFMENTIFTFPAAQNGAATGKYWYDNGGTAPGFTTEDFTYTISKDRHIQIYAAFITCDATGVGAVEARVALPCEINAAINPILCAFGGWVDDSASVTNLLGVSYINNNLYATMTVDGGSANLTNGDINASDNITFKMDGYMSAN